MTGIKRQVLESCHSGSNPGALIKDKSLFDAQAVESKWWSHRRVLESTVARMRDLPSPAQSSPIILTKKDEERKGSQDVSEKRGRGADVVRKGREPGKEQGKKKDILREKG